MHENDTAAEWDKILKEKSLPLSGFKQMFEDTKQECVKLHLTEYFHSILYLRESII